MQWGRQNSHVALVGVVAELGGALLCRLGHHKQQIIRTGPGWPTYAICSRCDEHL